MPQGLQALRLADKSVDTEEAADLTTILEHGPDDDRDLQEVPIAMPKPHELEPALVAQVKIEKDDIGEGHSPLKSLLQQILRAFNRGPGIDKLEPHRMSQVGRLVKIFRLVFNDQ